MKKRPPLVAQIVNELEKCNRCGFCQTRCPVYRVTGRETSVARGHIARITATTEGEIPFEEAREALFACLLCRACTAECPPAIRTDRIVSAARNNYLAQRQSRAQRFIFRTVLANPILLKTGVSALGWLKRLRLTSLVKCLRTLPWVDRGYAEAPTWMPIPKTFLRERLAKRRTSPATGKRVRFFVGCAIDLALPEVGEATLDLLEAAGCQVMVASNVCCGLPPYAYGDIEAARALARKNIEAMQVDDTEVIITDCASCASFLRDYPELFDKADPQHMAAQKLANRVKDLSQFLLELNVSSQLQPLNSIVTYHDPCHLSRYQSVTREPRELIQTIPGLEYRELPEADWCCGGAGSYSLSHYEISMQILARKMNNIRATGAEIIVTPCPACVMQLRYGAIKFGVPVKVIHLSELLRQALAAQSAVS